MTDDTIPEPKWLFRRIFIYGVTVVALILLTVAVFKITESQYLAGVCYGLIGLVAWLATLYLIAPSGEEIARMFAVKDLIGRRSRFPRWGRDYDDFDLDDRGSAKTE